MAKLIEKAGKFYSDFSVFVNGERHRINRALTKDQRESWIMMGRMMEAEKMKSASRQDGSGWEAFKMRLEKDVKKNEQTKYRDRLAFMMLENVFRPKTVSDITPKKLISLRDTWEVMGKTKPVINRAMSSIKAAMRRAEQWELVTEQAWSNVRRLKTPTSKKLIYSMESFKEFILPECHGVWRKVAMLGQFGALRRAEMYWLAVNDLDFSKDIIHICGKDGWIPKDGEDRDIPMFPDLKRFLQSVPMGQRWVLGDDRPSLEVMSSYFKKIVRRAGCKGGIHTLRHSCATWLGDNGWSDRQIADFLGHSKTDMTAGYIHGNVKALVEASRKIPQVLLQGHTPVVAVLKGSERPR